MWALKDKLAQQSICQGLGASAQGCPTSSHLWSPWERLLDAWPWPHCSRSPGRVTGGSCPTWGLPRSLLLEATCQSCTLTQHRRWGAGIVPWGARSVRPHCWGSEVVGDSLLSLWTPGGRVEVSGTPRVCSHSTKCPLLKENNIKLQMKNSTSGQERATKKKERKKIYFSTSNFSVFYCL